LLTTSSHLPSKPLHPATVHFPIAFLTLSYTLDILHFSTTTLLPKTNSLSLSLSPHLSTLALSSHYLLILGLLTGLISAATGGAQLTKMLQHGGMYESDNSGRKMMRPKVKTAFTHAGLNDVAMLMGGWSWWVRSKNAGDMGGLVGTGMANVVVSAVSLPVLLYSAGLGGKLVYNHGVGLSLGKKGKTG
jgi:uncharacterized membrane protein